MANFSGNWNPSIKYRNRYILEKSINQHEAFDLVLQIYFDLNFLFGARSTLNFKYMNRSILGFNSKNKK